MLPEHSTPLGLARSFRAYQGLSKTLYSSELAPVVRENGPLEVFSREADPRFSCFPRITSRVGSRARLPLDEAVDLVTEPSPRAFEW